MYLIFTGYHLINLLLHLLSFLFDFLHLSPLIIYISSLINIYFRIPVDHFLSLLELSLVLLFALIIAYF